MALQGARGTCLGALLPPRVAPRGALRLDSDENHRENHRETRGKRGKTMGIPWKTMENWMKIGKNPRKMQGILKCGFENLLENCVQLGAFFPRLGLNNLKNAQRVEEIELLKRHQQSLENDPKVPAIMAVPQ